MGNACCGRDKLKTPASVQAEEGPKPAKNRRRSVQLAVPEAPQSEQSSSHSRPRKFTLSDDQEVDEEEFHRILRGYTRKSFSSVDLTRLNSLPQDTTAGTQSQPPEIRSKDSRIDNRMVLRLLAKKGNNDEQKKLKEAASPTGDVDMELVAKAAPEIIDRMHKRRQTMEKLDIFSPDTETDRLEELYDATEKLLANSH